MCTNHLIKAFMKPADDINCTNGSSRLLPFLLVQAIAHREEGKKFSRAENALETLFPSSPPSPSALLFDTFLPECLSHSLLQVVQRVDLREREYGTPSIYRSRRSIPIADLQREMPLQPLQCRRSAATWTTCNATVSQNHFRPTPTGPPATPQSAKTISGLLHLDLLQRQRHQTNLPIPTSFNTYNANLIYYGASVPCSFFRIWGELLEREGEDCYICKNVRGKRPKAILHNNRKRIEQL